MQNRVTFWLALLICSGSFSSLLAITFEPPFEIKGRKKTPLTFEVKYSPTNIPTQFSATGLPTELTINPTSGVISGTPLKKITNQIVTVTAVQTNATNSQNYTLKVGKKPQKYIPIITSRLFKSIEIKWDPHEVEHQINGRYRITAFPFPTNFDVIFPVGETGEAPDVAWPDDWPEFKRRRGVIDFYYRETKRRIPVGTFPITIIAHNKWGSVSNTLQLEITKKDE